MRFLMMVQASQADYDAMNGRESVHSPSWSPEEVRAMVAHMSRLNQELADSGELVDAGGLAEPSQARVVTSAPGSDQIVVTDDPYDVTQQLIAGYWVLDCADLDRVTEIASQVTRSPAPAGVPQSFVVIRPFGDAPDPDRR
ncbi:YciI family protein [Streptomyces sp. NPDC059740]|uniref:YciI family protein n=1 Tax=Streptomyces sp. NPDC059740 TaxID=3346926 RepID=UPI00365881D2